MWQMLLSKATDKSGRVTDVFDLLVVLKVGPSPLGNLQNNENVFSTDHERYTRPNILLLALLKHVAFNARRSDTLPFIKCFYLQSKCPC